MSCSRFGYVAKDGSLENDPCLEALRDQPGQIDGCVDTDGCERKGVVNAFWQFRLRDLSKLEL